MAFRGKEERYAYARPRCLTGIFLIQHDKPCPIERFLNIAADSGFGGHERFMRSLAREPFGIIGLDKSFCHGIVRVPNMHNDGIGMRALEHRLQT